VPPRPSGQHGYLGPPGGPEAPSEGDRPIRTEARQEPIRERQTEAGFRRLAVPPSAQALFADVDPTDEQAMAARQ
jgi:hypothetical protein